jgi:hypothetical protein
VSTGSVKTCSLCSETKPLSEFYAAKTGVQGVMPYCKACDCKRPRRKTEARVLRLRARARAVSDLIKFHQDEFDALLAIRTAEAKEEAETLAATPEAAEHFQDTPVMLRPGKRPEGQTVTDRIDVARCPDCVKHHDRGHACTVCGSTPDAPKPLPRVVMPRQAPRPAPSGMRPRGAGIDPAALAEFNAGTQRASMGGRR